MFGVGVTYSVRGEGGAHGLDGGTRGYGGGSDGILVEVLDGS